MPETEARERYDEWQQQQRAATPPYLQQIPQMQAQPQQRPPGVSTPQPPQQSVTAPPPPPPVQPVYPTQGQPGAGQGAGGWYQPPMPQAPPGMAITQVMPQQRWVPQGQQPGQGWTQLPAGMQPPGSPLLQPGIPGRPGPVQMPEPGQPYMSDIATLRAMPQGMVDAYRNYISAVQQDPRFRGPAEAEISRLGREPADISDWQRDIGYLRGVPGQGEYETAYRTQAQENIDRKYAATAQNITRDAARRGLEPSSGVVQDSLRKLEEAKSREFADAERQLALWRMGETRSRLGEARGVSQMLEQMRTGRAGRGIGLAESLENAMLGRAGMRTGIFREMDAMEQARRGQARNIELQLDQQERQRLMDLMGYIQGAQPSSTPAALATQQNLAAQQMAGEAGAGFGGALGGLGQSLLYYQLMRNPSFINALGGLGGAGGAGSYGLGMPAYPTQNIG